MQRLLIYTFGLCATCALLIGGARLVGASQPSPSIVEGLRLTDCALPCWVGIIPGHTPMDEAYQKLLQAFSPDDNTLHDGSLNSLRLFLPVGDNVLPVSYFIRDGNIDVIQLFITEQRRLTLADIILTYGAPTCVIYNQSPVAIGWTLLYETPEGIAEIAAYGSESLRHVQRVYAIALRSRISDDGRCLYRDGRNRPRWRGFTHHSRYSEF